MPFIRNVRVLCKTRLIFPRINGPILSKSVHSKTPRKQVATEKCWLLMNELNVWQKIVAGVLHSADGRFFSCCFFFFVVCRVSFMRWSKKFVNISVAPVRSFLFKDYS